MLNLFQSKYPTVNNKNDNKKREGIIITIKIKLKKIVLVYYIHHFKNI